MLAPQQPQRMRQEAGGASEEPEVIDARLLACFHGHRHFAPLGENSGGMHARCFLCALGKGLFPLFVIDSIPIVDSGSFVSV